MTANILLVTSVLAFGLLFCMEKAIPDSIDIVEFGYDLSFLTAFLGFVLIKKQVQQLIALFLFSIAYNLDLLKSNLFKLQNDHLVDFARLSTIYFLALSTVFLVPTLFRRYKISPLTNTTNFKDKTIIIAVFGLTLLLQTAIRLTSAL